VGTSGRLGARVAPLTASARSVPSRSRGVWMMMLPNCMVTRASITSISYCEETG
jgi:hypothetical protein